jgi:lysophospholipase L1-like esterase
VVVLAALLTQAPRLFGHVSFRTSVWGRYSYSYVLALGAYLLLVGTAAGTVVWAAPLCRALARHPRAAASSAAVLAGVVAPMLMAEVALRLTHPFGLEYFVSVDRFLATLDREAAPLVYRNRAGLRIALEGVAVAISSQGLRDREYAVEKPAGTTRILVLGDSVVFGWGVRVEETFAKQLERLLREDGWRVEVLNTGVPSYDPTDEALYLRTAGLRYQPDVILVTVTTDDFLGRAPEQQAFDLRIILLDWLKGAAVRLRTAGLAFVVLSPLLDASKDIRVASHPGWQAMRRALADIVAAGDQAGARVAIAHFRMERTRLAEEVHELLWQECARLGVPCVDHLEAFRDRSVAALRNSLVDAHPNAAAHRLMAEQWRAVLSEPGWIGRPVALAGRGQIR